MSTKTILLTGATDGIGLETAKALVGLGHQLLIHGRSQDKLNTVAEQLDALPDAKPVDRFCADLSDMAATQKLATDIQQKHPALDVIINNAGVLKTPNPITAAGLDVRFAVNTLAPYLLSRQLLPTLPTGGRLVNLSSAAQESVDLALLRGERYDPEPMRAYSQSKLALTMWSRALAVAWQEKGLVVVSVNPGSLLASKMVKEGFGIAGNDITIGSDILVKAALSPEFDTANGRYFDNDTRRFAEPHLDATDDAKCAALAADLDEMLGLPTA